MLDLDELEELESSVKEELEDNLLTILSKLNRTGKLEEAFEAWGLEHLLHAQSQYEVYKSGKILVFGQTDVKANVLLAVAKSSGIDSKRVELHLDYNDAKKYQFKHIQYNPDYSVILFGPTPHSGKAKEDYGSIISSVEHTDGYPPVIRLGQNELKITKTNFRDAINDLLENGVLRVA